MKRVRCWSCDEWMLILDYNNVENTGDKSRYCDSCTGKRRRRTQAGLPDPESAKEIEYHGEHSPFHD